MAVNVLGKGEFYSLTDRGLLITGSPCYSDWAALGVYVSQLHGATPWIVGDWLVWGEDRFAEAYAQAVEATGLEYATLRNYKWVARAFPVNKRFVELSFTHHLEVAGMDQGPRETLLLRCVNEKISSRELRYLVRGGTVDGPIADPSSAMLAAPLDGKNWYQIAIEAWNHLTHDEREVFLSEIGH